MMQLFNIKKEYDRLNVVFFGIKMSFLLGIYQTKNRNKFIPLGTNCYTRVQLSHFGIKPKKKFKELTCPFDLCAMPIETVDKLLNEDFNNYFDNIQFSHNYNMYVNKTYNIHYPHDRDLKNKEDLINRYKKRINNFRTVINSKKSLVFISTIFNKKIDAQILNNIYNALLKYRNNNPFKYYVFNFNEGNEILLHNKQNLNPNITYNEFNCDICDYFNNWGNKKYNTAKHQEMIKQFVSIIYQSNN